MTRRALGLLALLAAGLLLRVLPATAQEDPDRIARFAAEVTVEADGALLVSEEIDFLVTPESWKHGIYRDFPTRHHDAWGLSQRVGFEVLEVTRDGQAEPYVLEPAAFGVRLRIGSADDWLRRGLHRYRLAYRTTRQLIFGADFDEIYWNVTGNEWAHPIDRAEATVHLPAGAAPLQVAGYTGTAGDSGADFIQGSDSNGSVTFVATRTLSPGEGLTVAVAFPKGFVAEPEAGERLRAALADNLGLLAGLAGLVVTFAYFLLQWWRVGRDPEAGVIIPLFEAPDGLSPAATGFVWATARGTAMRSTLAFAVALTSLAIKGYLAIADEGANTVLSAKATDKAGQRRGAKLPPGEAGVLQALFKDGRRDRVVMKPTYDAEIANAVSALDDVLRQEHGTALFRHNSTFWLLGALIALGGIAATFLLQTGDPAVLILVAVGLLFAGAFTIPVVVILRAALPQWRALLQGRARSAASTIFITLFALPFSVPALVAAWFALEHFGPAALALTVAQLALVALFWHLLKAPTRLGRALLDRIEGYRLYLSVAERDRLHMLTGEPAMTVDRFERHLPYAMALGVEEQWAARFAATADAASRAAAEARSRSWYHSRRMGSDLSTMAAGLSGGLSRTLSSASTRPSSSSGGSAGGGSSGGGGGGGGGGSW